MDTTRGAVRPSLAVFATHAGNALHAAKLAARQVIRMVTGAPFMHAPSGARFLLTKFSLDQDAVTLASPGLLAQDVETHFARIRKENHAFDVVFRLGLKVLEIASAFTPTLAGFKAVTPAWRVLRRLGSLPRSVGSV